MHALVNIMQTKQFVKRGIDKLVCGPSIFLFSLLFSIYLHKKLGMDGFWDTSNYHVYVGWAASILMPYEFGATAQYHTYLNPIIDIVNYTAFSTHPFLGATVHSIFFAIAAYIVFRIGQIFFEGCSTDKLTLLIGFIISITGAMTISLFGSWTNENIIAVFVLAGLYLLLRGIDNEVLFMIFSSGLAFGIAIGLKLTSGHYLVGALFATIVSTKFNLKIISLLCTGIIMGFLITDGYYMHLRWETVDSPMFPLANNLFKSPFYPESWKSFSHFDPLKTLYYLSLPVTWLNSGDFSEASTVRDGRFLLGFIGIGLIVLGSAIRRNIGKMELTLLAFFLASFIAWILTFRVYRYLIVLEMVSGILFIIGIKELFGSNKRLVNISISIGAIFFLWQVTVYPNWGRREWSDDFTKNNLMELIKEKEGSVVFFADQRLSYLSPELYKNRIRFANLYSQDWWDGERGSSVEDPDRSIDPKSIDLSKFDKIYFLQYSNFNPMSKSAYLSKLFSGKNYDCQLVSTNMSLNPLLCSYKDF